MSIRVNRKFESQLSNVLHAENVYNEMALKAVKAGYIKLTDKQLETVKALQRTNAFSVKQSFTALSTSDRTMSKHMILSAQLPASPLRESNLASEKVMRSVHIRDIMQYLLSKESDEQLNALFLTFSFKNCDFGHLADAQQALNDIYKKLRKYSERTLDWGNAQYLGCLPSLETTVNTEHLLKQEKTDLYHPHFHVILFYEGEVNLGSLYRQLWKKYSELCAKANAKASSSAFFLEKTYDKNDDEINIISDDDKKEKSKKRKITLANALAEATKYATKPADLMKLAITKNDSKKLASFKLKVWAEIYNANVHPKLSKNCKYTNVKEAKLIRANGSGLYQKANQVYKAITDAGLGGLLDFQPSNGDLSRIPSVFTKAVTVDIKNIVKENNALIAKTKSESTFRYYAEIAKTHSLNRAEILYYNKSILKNTTFLSGLAGFKRAVAKSNYGLSNKSRVIVDVIENFARWNQSVDDINEVIDEWIDTVMSYTDSDGNYNAEKVHDIQMLKSAYHYAVNDDNYKQLRSLYQNYVLSDYIKHDDDKNKLELLENGHVKFNNTDFYVRSWRNLDLAKKIAHQAKKDGLLQTMYATGRLQKFYRQVLKGNANLCENDNKESEEYWLIHTIRQYVPLFVSLKFGEKVKFEKELKLSYQPNTWNFWEGASYAQDSKVTGLTAQLQLLVSCLLYAMDSEKYEETVLCANSLARTVNVEVDSQMLKNMTNHLLKNNWTNNNPLFKKK